MSLVAGVNLDKEIISRYNQSDCNEPVITADVQREQTKQFPCPSSNIPTWNNISLYPNLEPEFHQGCFAGQFGHFSNIPMWIRGTIHPSIPTRVLCWSIWPHVKNSHQKLFCRCSFNFLSEPLLQLLCRYIIQKCSQSRG